MYLISQDNYHLGQTLAITFFISYLLLFIFTPFASLLASRLLTFSPPPPPPWTTAILVGPKYLDSSYSLEATHCVDPLSLSLFSFPRVPWLIQSDHALNGRSKEISCCSSKDILNLDTSAKDTLRSSLKNDRSPWSEVS